MIWSPNGTDCFSLAELVARRIAEEYELGGTIACLPLEAGFFSVRFKLDTARGSYFVKLFTPEKTPERASSITGATRTLSATGLAVPAVHVTSQQAPYFSLLMDGQRPTYGCVLDWFEGRDFVGDEVCEQELKAVTDALATIHALPFRVAGHYDWWFTTNLPFECVRKLGYVPDERHRKLIAETAAKLEMIDFSRLRLGSIHGDLGRQNVLHNANRICLVDFDAINTGSVVADLAVTMSHFCLPLDLQRTPQVFSQRYNLMLTEYLRNAELSNYEINALPVLLAASYGIYCVAGFHALQELNWGGATHWIRLGITGLEMTSSCDFEPCLAQWIRPRVGS